MKIISVDKGLRVHFYSLIFASLLVSAVARAHASPLSVALSQQQAISGTVSDALGPLPGVAIQVKGTSTVTVSDENGKYIIAAGPTDVLLFSFVGFRTIDIPVSGRSVINTLMTEDATQLQELEINAGYYTVKDKERTGSIARVTAKEIENQPVANVLSAVQGRVSGVNITQNTGVAGGGYTIQIRGTNSLRREGNNPLYIINGVPVSDQGSSSLAGTILPYGAINPLNSINPNDIESIEILKDADATAIYGSRGANGVVLVTTKKGKSGATSFTVNSSYGMSNVASKMRMMDTGQYLEMRRQGFANDGVSEYPDYAYDINGAWNQQRHTDWQDELIGRTATNSMLQLSLKGGNEHTSFMVSGSHNEQGTVFSDAFMYKTNNLSTSVQHRSKDGRLQLNITGLFSAQSNNVVNEDLTKQALYLSPNAPALYNENGSLNWENNTFTNPVAAFESTYANDTKTFNSNINLGYKVLPSLAVKLNGGIAYAAFSEMSLMPNTMYNPAYGMTTEYSMAFKSQQSRFSYLFEPQLEYILRKADHELEVLAGATFQQADNDAFSAEGYGFQSNALLTNLSAATTQVVSQDAQTQYKYGAVFGRVNYKYRQRYILNVTGRRDGSSRFGPDNRFANFGAIGGAWIFSRESFLADASWLSHGKLRASFGTSGSDLIGDYQYLDTYTVNSSLYSNSTGLAPSRLYNPNFSWEKTTKVEAALEVGLWQDRVNVTAAWYRNRSGNQLVGIPLPATTGFANILSNLPAKVENTGWEFDLNLVPVSSGSFRWETGINLSIPRNKLLDFPALEGSTYANRYVIGKPVSIAKLFNYEGIDPQTGLYRFTDYNGDGKITAPEDAKIIENIGVKYFGGWSGQLSYNNWGLSYLFQFVKQDQWNYNSMMPTPGSMNNQPVEVLDVWSSENPDGRYMPYTAAGDPVKGQLHGFLAKSTAAVSDASFIRLKNIQVSYRLPVGKLFSELLLYAQGQNLLTFTDYYGLDPEFSLSGYLPPLKTYSFGVQLTF